MNVDDVGLESPNFIEDSFYVAEMKMVDTEPTEKTASKPVKIPLYWELWFLWLDYSYIMPKKSQTTF